MSREQRNSLELQVRLELKKLELSKLRSKLNSLRSDWSARTKELSEERLSVLSDLQAQEQRLANELREEQQVAEEAMAKARLSFDTEISVLSTEKEKLHSEFLHQKQQHEKNDVSLRDASLQLSSEMNKLFSTHASMMDALAAQIESVKNALDEETKRRMELEEHFKRVDRNNAAMKLEAEKLKLVAAKEEEAKQLLHNGACALQKLWRGLVTREQVEKLKKQKSKKKKGKGKKGGKKKK